MSDPAGELMVYDLYHVTPYVNVGSIGKAGLLIDKSRSKRKAVWLCDDNALLWAIAHVSMMHETPTSELYVLSVNILRARCAHAHLRGVYTVTGNIQVELIRSRGFAMGFIDRAGARLNEQAT